MEQLTPQLSLPGRSLGTSKAVAELRALARANTTAAFSKLVELLHSSDQRVALMAAKEILDRGFGRPAPAEEDADERTVVVQIVHIDQAPSSSPGQARSPRIPA